MEEAFPIFLILALIAFVYVLISLIAMIGAKKQAEKQTVLKAVYIYTVSFISLLVFLFGTGKFLYDVIAYNAFPKVVENRHQWELDRCDYKDYDNRRPVYVDGEEVKAEMANDEERDACREEVMAINFQESMLLSLIFILLGLPTYALHFFVFRRSK